MFTIGNTKPATKAAILAGIPHDAAKLVARNTVRYSKGDTTAIRLHGTDVVTFLPRGRVRLDSGGWKTQTTKARMNEHLPKGYSVYNAGGGWRLGRGGNIYGAAESVPFYDGLTFTIGKPLPRSRKSVETRQARDTAAIKRFVAGLYKLPELPQPSSGDCWLCALHDREGKTMGDHGDNAGHLREHIREGYLHGSLLVNAMRAAGWPDQRIRYAYTYDDRKDVARCLRRYLRRELGLTVGC